MSGTERPDRGRILLSTSNFPRWEGDSTTPFVLHLARDLVALGWSVDVLAPHAPGCATHENLGGLHVERFRYLWPERLESVCYQGGALINLRRKRSNFAKLPALVLCEWAAVMRRLATRRYDLLHSHWLLPQGFTGVVAARPMRVPHVITVHGGDVFALRGPLLERFKRFALAHADAVTVNSSATRAAVLETADIADKLHTIPMGASETPVDRKAAGRIRERYGHGAGPLLAFVGRLIHEKGADDLIAAVELLRERLPDTTALIIGEGPDRAALQGVVNQRGLGDRITFTGWVAPDEVANYLAAADVFVGPSRQGPGGWIEAQGLTFLEAMLAGTPVVATTCGGIVDAVRHEVTGILVAQNAPQEIAAGVARLMSEPDLRRRLTAAAQRAVRLRFTRSASAQAFSDLFDGQVLRHAVRQQV